MELIQIKSDLNKYPNYFTCTEYDYRVIKTALLIIY